MVAISSNTASTTTAMATIMDDSLDILGQQSFLYRLYTQICLVYPVEDASSYESIVSTLSSGLDRLASSFPWVAGQTIPQDGPQGTSKTFKMASLDKSPLLVVKDLRDDDEFPSMKEFRKAKFPFAMLDENVIAPTNTIPGTRLNETDSTARIFIVQATIIRGGLLLTINGQHNVMDMVGQAQLMALLSKACRGGSFTDEEIKSGNLPRRDLIPLLPSSHPLEAELENQLIDPAAPPPCFGPDSSWAYFLFSPSSLALLKREATSTLPSSSPFISTDDALCALIWRCTTRARLARLQGEQKETTPITTRFARAIDARKPLNIPTHYPGLLTNMTYSAISIPSLLSETLGETASSSFRAKLASPDALATNTRALVTYLNNNTEENRNAEKISLTARNDPGRDISLSSWAKVDCYSLDFGLGLGAPEAVRRPKFVPVEGLMYLMPRRGDGELALGMCLRGEDLERLQGDEEFARFAEFIG